MEKRRISTSAEETEILAESIGREAFSGALIALWGEMGAGKTAFVHGLCRGMGLPDNVSSPTFALIHEHDGPIPLYHFDLYRLSSEEELFSVGVEEYWYGTGLSVIEWPELAGSRLPKERLDIRFRIIDDNCRELCFQTDSLLYKKMLEALL